MSTLIFAAVAAFVLWKLWSVLGYRTGNERPPVNPFAPRPDKTPMARDPGAAASNVIRLPGAAIESPPRNVLDPARWAGFADPGSAVWAGLDAIFERDPNFAPKPFVAGARTAYEMIVTAFAAGDRKALRNLLASDVFESFSQVINLRESKGESVTTTFVSLDTAAIEEAHVEGTTANITMRFMSKMISATKDRAGAVVDGKADQVVDHSDVWTFARDTTSRDLNWRLIATEGGR